MNDKYTDNNHGVNGYHITIHWRQEYPIHGCEDYIEPIPEDEQYPEARAEIDRIMKL